MTRDILLLVFTGVLFSCTCTNPVEKTSLVPDRPLAKFEPEGDRCLLFVGQELEAIGGLEEYKDGYLDHFERPAGFTMYTNFHPGDTSFGYVQKGLDGIWTTDDWGDSPSNMTMQLADPDFENMALAIGLAMVGHEHRVADGTHDKLITRLGEWIKSLGRRPVFLRIGYEFDGHSWNHYEREAYKAAFIRVHELFEQMEVENVAFVWQSTGWVTPLDLLDEWYPGDEYVDWCGYSFFARWEEAVMIDFARSHGKPVFIAEASPTLGDHTIKFDGITRTTMLSDPEQASEAWEKWFTPFFQTIEENSDIVKAVSYINCNWKDHIMWKQNPTFRFIDARLQLSAEVSSKWKQKVSTDAFIHSYPELYDDLWNLRN